MDLPIFYQENIVSENIVTLSEDTSRHVVQVLRMKPMEKLQLTDGVGNLLTAEILDDHKKKCTVRISAKQYIPEKEQQVCIAISLLKNASRLEWFLEKATEIGVTEIIPLLCGRTEKQHFRFERMKQLLVSAMIQSKQAWLPVLHEPAGFAGVVASSTYTAKLIAHCEVETKVEISDFRKQASVQILIGPEGDFTADEIKLAKGYNYQPVTLGDTRLRTETAGVVAATLLCI
jgi:16S rRNA (uracil1498-N3)-methyltransferase